MKKFTSMTQFAEYLSRLQPLDDEYKEAALTAIGEYVKEKAKSKFGEYQSESGEFPAWEQLAESTQAQRERLGFEPNNPLYRTGDLMESIDYSVTANKVRVGSDNEIAVWQEEGTPTIPPRPFIGPAMFESVEEIKKILGLMMVNWLTGEKKVNKIK